MKRKIVIACFLSVILVYMLACNKENVTNYISVNNSSIDRAVIASTCDSFAYSDSILYPEEVEEDYIVKPRYKLTGTFGAYPDGLEINKYNGNIDITESETGLKYLVWFAPAGQGQQDTCKIFITVAGINYTDSIYTLTSGNPGIMKPVYNANPLKPTDCNGFCEFDDGHDDDDGDGFTDEPPLGQEVIPQGIAMDKSNGKVNLRKSLKNGALGINPSNGTIKNFKLNYRIADKSSKTLNKIGFRLYYYKTKADIPVSLRKQVEAKQKLILYDDTDTDPYQVPYSVSAATNGVVAKHGNGETRCRPPYIIVTGKL